MNIVRESVDVVVCWPYKFKSGKRQYDGTMFVPYSMYSARYYLVFIKVITAERRTTEINSIHKKETQNTKPILFVNAMILM